MSRAENRTMPKVEGGYCYGEEEAFSIDGARWAEWLIGTLAFYFTSQNGTFTARKELRSGSWYWYAYRRRAGKLTKCYIGRSHELTGQRLRDVAQRLADKAV